MSTTPLSDRIASLVHASSDELLSAFHSEFLRAKVGLVLSDLPVLPVGTTFTVTDGIGPRSQLVLDPTGRPMIRVCADPETFEQNYHVGINALMSGREVLAMLLKLPDVHGVLVCSATSFISCPIYREIAQQLISARNATPTQSKRWWAFWK